MRCRVTTPVFGGNVLVTTTFTGPSPHLAAFRPKSFAAEPSGGGAAEVVAAPVPDLGATGAAAVVAVHVEESTGPKLDEANIVVSGGRGLGEAAKYEMIETARQAAEGRRRARRVPSSTPVGCPTATRSARPARSSSPACTSPAASPGATQHMVGMKGAKNIIAINKDKEAPIFGIADLGIVGDVHKVLPEADRGASSPRLRSSRVFAAARRVGARHSIGSGRVVGADRPGVALGRICCGEL